MSGRYQSFTEFYPFYLSQHENRICRRLHFVGSALALGLLATALVKGSALWLLPAIICPYALAWIGHFVFEKNRPATFTYPLWSFIGDWKMFGEMLRGKIAF